MDDAQKYEEQLVERRKFYADKLIKANAAKEFTKTPQGELAQEMITERVSLLMNKAFAKDHLTYEQYLSVHGSVKELQMFTKMLYAKEADRENLEAQLKVTDTQLSDMKKPDGQETV